MCIRCIVCTVEAVGCVWVALWGVPVSVVVSNYWIFCGCVLCVLFCLGRVVSNAPSVGDMYVWLCKIGPGSIICSIICGFVLAEQIGLACVFMLHPASGDWEVSYLFWAARSAVTTGPVKSRVRVGSSCQATAALGLGVILCIAYVVNDSSSLSGRLRLMFARAVAFCSVVSSVSSGR